MQGLVPRLFFPEVIVVGMVRHLVPVLNLAVQIAVVEGFEGARGQIPVIGVPPVESEMGVGRFVRFLITAYSNA